MMIRASRDKSGEVRTIRVSLLSLNWTRVNDPRTPLGIAYIYSWLKSHRSKLPTLKIELLDYDIRGNLSDVIHGILLDSPDILGISVYAWNAESVSKITMSLRLLGFTGITVLGGPEITYGDSALVNEFPYADYFVKGEGEEAFETIVRAYSEGKTPEGDGIFSRASKDFNGFAQVKHADEIVQPHTVPELLPRISNDSFSRIQWQRGCLFRCSFCAFKFPNNFFREIHIDQVKTELYSLVETGVKHVAVLDPIFFLHKDRALQILKLAKETAPGIRFEIQPRIEHMDREILETISGMNVLLECGIQTLDMRVQREIKRLNNIEKIVENLGQMNKMGIKYEAHLIYGLPYQTLGSFLGDLDTIFNYEPSRVRVFPLSLLKGTELYDDVNTKYDGRIVFSPVFPREVISTDWINSHDILTLKSLQEIIEYHTPEENKTMGARTIFNLATQRLEESLIFTGDKRWQNA